MRILIGILPAFMWGAGPLIATVVGGKPVHQLMGTCYGQIVISLVLYLIFRPMIDLKEFLWCFFGGLFWSIAQLMQFDSFKKLNVSTSMPISTGLQLIEIPLAGVIFWGEWGTPAAKLAGFIAIVVLIAGISFTSVNDNAQNRAKMNYKVGLVLLIIGSFGYTASSVFPKVPGTSGNAGIAAGISGMVPQTIGSFLGAIILGIWMQKRLHQPVLLAKISFKNIWTGLLGGLGIMFYLMSLGLNGVATSFPLTQLNVVVSTIGGIFLLHETKDHKEMAFTVVGLIMIIASAFVIGSLS